VGIFRIDDEIEVEEVWLIDVRPQNLNFFLSDKLCTKFSDI